MNALSNGFVWDDTVQILQNPSLRPGAPWLRLLTTGVWAFAHPGKTSVGNYYRPLQMLTYRVVAQMFGFSAPAFHAVNLIFHLLATVLVYSVLFQITRRIAFAAAAATLFALHPIHTEAVAWASALPELGCAVFYFLSFLLFLLALRFSVEGDGGTPATVFHQRLFWLLSCASFALALFWKEMAGTLPLVVALYLFLFSPDEPTSAARIRRSLQGSLPYGAVLAAYLVLRYYAIGFLYVSQRDWVLSRPDFALTVVDLVAKYWWKLLLPVHLNAYHVFDPIRSWAEPRALGAIVFLALVVAGAAWGYRRFPLAVFAVGWVFCTLIPVLDLRAVGRNVFAERYLYIPSLGFCLLLVWIANRLSARLPAGLRSGSVVSALIVVAGLYLVQTARRNPDWKDSFTFFSRTLAASPNSPDMEISTANLLLSERNDPAGAEQLFQRARSLAEAAQPPVRDQIAAADIGLALISSERQEYDRALDLLTSAQNAWPGDTEVHSVRGSVLLQAGRWREAQRALQAAIEVDPDDANAWNGLGFIAWQDEHRDADAAHDFQHALKIDPPSVSLNASLQDSLGAVYCEMGNYPEGLADLKVATALAPDDPEYHTNLAIAMESSGQLAQARAELEKALALAPGDPSARAALSDLEKQNP